jgi:hypothetical protein
MNTRELEVLGSLLAIRSTLSLLLAKIADDRGDPELPSRMHSLMATIIEGHLEKKRATAPGAPEAPALATLQAASIAELDTIFGLAHSLLRGRPAQEG